LRQYDADISTAADEVSLLGPKWQEELAAAYMAISDKSYLGPIVAKLKERAAAEIEAKKAEEARRAAALRAPQNQSSMSSSVRSSSGIDDNEDRKPRLWLILFIAPVGILIIWALAVSEQRSTPAQSGATMPAPAPVAAVTPSFDCSTVTADTLKLVCKTPELATADLRLAKAYNDAITRTASKAILRREERAWIIERNNGPADVAHLKQVYEQRIAKLERYTGN